MRASLPGDEDDVTKLEKLKTRDSAKRFKVRDNRDSLPYYVDVVSPPPSRPLGVFALDKNTQSGDLVEYGSTNYEVKKVRQLYRYRSGRGMVMIKKAAEVVEASRLLEERWLQRAMKLGESGQ